jgi:fumarate reductase (CoM/CoB) subunit A
MDVGFDKIQTDILIIGGGGAAAMAALSAKRLGAKVSIVSKESSLVGGATIQASGGISSLFDPNDNPEKFYKDILAGGGFLNNRKLVKLLAERASSALYELEAYYPLDRDQSGQFHMIKGSEGHSSPRGYLDRRESIGLCRALGKALLKERIEFYPEVIIEKLLVNHGQVVGAFGFDLVRGGYVVFNARAVILATGGLGQLYRMTTNAKTLTGDGYVMAWEVGARLTDMEMVQFIPLAFPYPECWKGVFIGMCSIWGPKVKLFNGFGKRYMEDYDPERLEYSTRDVVSRANYTEIIEGRGTEKQAIIVDPTENDPDLLSRYQSSFPHVYGRVGKIFGPDAVNWRGPFEAIPSQHFFMGGIVIDEGCKTDVPGLFAVGEVAGGVHGANRLSGNALTEILVFGSLAGESAAKWIKHKSFIAPNRSEVENEVDQLEKLFNFRSKDGVRPFKIKEMIQETMWNDLGPVRHKEGMKRAVATLEDIRRNGLSQMVLASHHSRYNKEKVELCEVRFMVQAALFLANSALAREESRGSHFRKDFPAIDNKEWLGNIVIGKDNNDGIPTFFKKVPVDPYAN